MNKNNNKYNKNINRDVIFLSDDENDSIDDLLFIKIQTFNDTCIDKNTKDEISTPIKSFQSFVADENLLPNKKPIYDDTYNPLSQIKIINVESLSEKKNCWMENDSSINTYTTQRPPLIRVKSEFSEKKMIERKFSIDEDTNTDYQTKILSSDTISVKNIPKKYLPIVLLHRIVVPKKSLDPPAVVIKTEKEELENFSIKTEYDESKPTEQPVQPSKISNSHGPTAYKCTKCNYTFDESSHLIQHKIKYHNGRPYSCHLCSFTSSSSRGLKNHINFHSKKAHKCSFCKYATTRPILLKEHMSKHTGEAPFKCPHCPFSTAYQRSLKTHELIHADEPGYSCSVCPSSFYQPQNLKRHILTHTRNRVFECDYCKKVFFRKCHLKNHIFAHMNIRRFQCEICQLKFIQLYHLQRHRRTHFREKLYPCDVCPEKFDRLYSLKQHVFSAHTDKKRQYACDICDLKFNRSDYFKRHNTIHHAGPRDIGKYRRLYRCKICHYVTTSAIFFNEHFNKHMDRNLVICNECGRSFEQRKNLNVHLRHHKKLSQNS
ncbi:zinc finger protein 883-like isoform X2 [Microplitis mediator]|uniref:zinc finger protein 883-like isoform X2 n=1 Tax=Microplitis mediator TaxID=375433 RepID=UPI002553804D|nr:zinc finger protein 883-like isoform X2 [Microplitis mediator]